MNFETLNNSFTVSGNEEINKMPVSPRESSLRIPYLQTRPSYPRRFGAQIDQKVASEDSDFPLRAIVYPIILHDGRISRVFFLILHRERLNGRRGCQG